MADGLLERRNIPGLIVKRLLSPRFSGLFKQCSLEGDKKVTT